MSKPDTSARSKPRPDILRDARRVRDILADYDAAQRDAIIRLAIAAVDQQTGADS